MQLGAKEKARRKNCDVRFSLVRKNLDLSEKLHEKFEVQRTIKRAELTAFLCLMGKAIGPTIVHVDNNGIIDGLWKGEMKCIGPTTKDADLWILISEELHRVHQGLLVEVEHVKAHRSKKEKQQMSLFEKFVTEGNEKRTHWQQMDECWLEERWRKSEPAQSNT